MKLNWFTDGLRAVLGKFKKKPNDGDAKPLSYQRLTSRFFRVRFAAQANAAGARRRTRHEVLQGIRRNTVGLPLGFSWRQHIPSRQLKLLMISEPDSVRVKQAIALSSARKVGSELRKQRTGKMASKIVRRSALSCSANRSMVTIMERRDLLGKGTDVLGIKEPAAYSAQKPTMKERLFQRAFASLTSQHPQLPRHERREAARQLAKLVRCNMRGLAPVH